MSEKVNRVPAATASVNSKNRISDAARAESYGNSETIRVKAKDMGPAPQPPKESPPSRPPTTVRKPKPLTVTAIPIFETFDRLETVLTLEKDLEFTRQKPEAGAGAAEASSSDISLSSEEEAVGGKKKPTYIIPPKPKAQSHIVKILFDPSYRADNQTESPETEGLIVFDGRDKFDLKSDSDTDPETEKFIAGLEEKRENGENVSGETLWYDDTRSMIRNLHPNGSVSLTGYEGHDDHIFGRADILHPILTQEQRKMLGIQDKSSGEIPIFSKKSSISDLQQQAQLGVDGGMGDGFRDED